jgi:hypothetical protein
MTLLLLYFAFGEFGHPAYPVRAAAARRCDCLIGAVLAPAGHPDPEVRRRVGVIRDRWFGRSLRLWLEYQRWRAADADPDAVMLELQHAPLEVRDRFLTMFPLPPDLSTSHLRPPLLPCDPPAMRAHIAWERRCAAGGGVLCLSR